MLDRRASLAGVIGVVAAPLAPEAQQTGKTWRVGFLSGGTRTPDGFPPLPLRETLQELGYVEQQNVVYLGRWAELGAALIHAAIFRCEPWREWLDMVGALVMSTIALFVGYGVVRAYLAMRRRQDAELGS